MKIKLDENIPFRVENLLRNMGHDVDSVLTEGITGSSDETVWSLSQYEKRFLITQDLDFSDSRKFSPGTHCWLLLVRLRNPGRERIFNRIEQVFHEEDVESWFGCFVVVSELKIRVQRPK